MTVKFLTMYWGCIDTENQENRKGRVSSVLENFLQAAVFDCYESLGKIFKAVIYNIHYDLF